MSATVESRPAPALPGFFRGAAAVAGKDLRVEWRTLESMTAMALFSLVVLLVFSFAFSLGTIRELGPARLVPGVLWTVFGFASIVGFARSFQGERRNDTLSGLRLAPLDAGAVFVGKALANLLKLSLLELLVLPLSAVVFDYDLFAAGGALALVVLLHSLGLTAFGTLAAAVAARLGRGEALVATLLFPVCSPLFISAVKCTRTAIELRPLGDDSMWLGLAGGWAVLFTLVALLAFDHVLEE